MDTAWLLLIYTVPSQPSRKRAAIWRELKKLGAVYLRDGVAVLPDRMDLGTRLRAVADRVQEYEGTADLVPAPPFPEEREAQVIAQFQQEREAEYREIYHACVRFLRDVLEDVSAEDFGFPDVGNLESELGRLSRYYDQIKERDYFGAAGADRVEEILQKCERAFEAYTDTASGRVERAESDMPSRAPAEDVFDRLGGPAAADHELPL